MRRACLLALVLAPAAAPRALAQQSATWETWTPVKLTSAGGATFTAQPDGSFVVGGANPEKDTFTLEFSLERNGWNALKIEALPDPSLPSNGPGRTNGGNFVLSEARLAAAPRNSDGFKPAPLDHPSADFEQVGWSAAGVLDGVPGTGWAIWPGVGKSHEWIAQFARPLGFDGGVKATLTLDFLFGGQHALGRFRVSGSTSPLPIRATVSDGGFGEIAGRIPGAMEAAIGWLLDRQLLDGSWSYKQPEYRHGTTALAAYALIKAGVRKDHPAVQRAFAFMDAALPNRTYEAGLELMARGALDDERQLPRMEEVVARLLAWQVGGWSYPSGGPDLSNTQYAAMGLRAAAQRGVRIPNEVWTKLGDEVLTHQPAVTGAYEPAGFGYGPRGNVFGSMTAAGVGVMRICVEQLERNGSKPPAAYSTAYKRGITWIGKHFLATGNPLVGPEWTIYWLYSVERVGGLCGVTEFEGHDWYREGARYLIPIQAPTGQWEGHDGPASHTCFALLFLARATAPASGLVTRGPKLYGGDDPKAPASLRASGDTPLTLWVSSFGEAELAKLAWPEDQGKGLRVAGVDYVLPGRALLPAAQYDAGRWHWTTAPPTAGWERPEFDPDAAKWASGPGAFGLPGSAGTAVRTEWRGEQLWIRRRFELDEAPLVDPQLLVHHGSALPIRPGALETAPLVPLFDEEPDFAAQLTERPEKSTANVVEKDAANGRRCLAVTPLQSFSANLRGWNWPIAEKPQPGEFRFLRLAWRKEGGGGIMVQLAFNGAFDGRTRRVFSGPNEVGWAGTQVEKEAPKGWKVVTVDLWKELGAPGVLTGLAFTPMKAGVAYFDAIWLARAESDFKAIPKSGVPEKAEPLPAGANGAVAPPADAPVATVATGEGPSLEIWVNGTRAWAGDDEFPQYAPVATSAPLASLLHPGSNVVAVYCRRRGPGQSVDVALADQRVLARVDGRPDVASPAERWPSQVSFEKNGVYVLRARAHVRPPPADGSRDAAPEVLVESAPLTVRIREAPDPELLSFAQDPARNLVFQVGATVTASSFRDPGWAPHLAADNFQSRGWLSADGDTRPVLALALNKPVRADAVLVSPLGDWVKQIGPDFAPRVRRVEVAVDGGKGGTFELVLPDDGRKGVLRWPRPMVVRRLDVRVLDAEGGAERKNGVGLAEVELQISNRK